MHVVLRNDQVGSALLDHVVHPRRVNLPLTVQATPTKKQSKREKKTSYQKSMCVRSLRGITNRERCRKRRAHLPMASALMVLRWASHPAAKMFYRGPTRVRAKIAAIRKKRTRTFLGAVPGTCRLRRGRRIWPSPPPWPRRAHQLLSEMSPRGGSAVEKGKHQRFALWSAAAVCQWAFLC
jgi:hypothetical protein